MICQTDDIALFIGFQQKKPDAEYAVFHLLFRPLCLYAEKITGQKEQAEDIVADAFILIFRQRENFQTLENFKRFLYRIVRNASINYTIQVKNRSFIHEKIRYLQKGDMESSDKSELEILRVELLNEIYQEVENLPDKCRAIFKMIFLEGIPTDHIALQLHLNPQTVRSQKARAIRLIKTGILKKKRILAILQLFC